jgi:transposase
MEEYIVCGIDAHERTLDCQVGVGRQDPTRRRFANTREGRGELFEEVAAMREQLGAAKVLMGYEASPLGYVLYDECVEHGMECVVLAPTKIARSVQDRKRKYDERDAMRIYEALRAHVLAGNALPGIWIPGHQTRDDREVCRCRLDLTAKLTAVKAQVRMLLKRNRIEKPEEVGQSWTLGDRAWLEGLRLTAGAQVWLSSLLRQVEALEAEIERLDRELLELAEEERYRAASQALRGMGGIGVLTAMVFLTEMGDLRRFKSRKQIGAYLGLVPSSHESGEGDERKGHITHEGPARVRKVLCQAVWSRLRTDPQEADAYRRLVGRNPKHRKIAVVACMRRLAILMWHRGIDAQRPGSPAQAA